MRVFAEPVMSMPSIILYIKILPCLAASSAVVDILIAKLFSINDN